MSPVRFVTYLSGPDNSGDGGGASLRRTRLHIEFPDKQGINREYAVEMAFFGSL